jgi:hypothetical protein
MHGEATLYRRIQVVLDYANQKRHGDLMQLASYICSRQPTNFIYYWRDRKTDKIQHAYSEKAIENTVNLCGDLGLLAKSADGVRLTKAGLSACDPVRFPAVLGRVVSEFLSTKGVSLDSIKTAIKKTMTSKDPQPPTFDAIWSHLELNAPQSDLDDLKFRQLLNLLGQSSVLLMSQRRIFLPRS